MSPLEHLFDEGFAHAILLRRNQELFARNTLAVIVKNEREFADRLELSLSRLSQRDLQRLASARFSGTLALDRFTKTIAEMLSVTQAELTTLFGTQLRDLAKMESAFWKKQLEDVVEALPELVPAGVKPAAQNRAATGAAVAAAAVLGATLSQSLSTHTASRRSKLRRVIATAAAEGATQLKRALSPTAKDRARGRIIGGSSAGIQSWARTLHTNAASLGATGVEMESGKVIDLVAVNVLDSKTTAECWSRHGKLVNRDMNGETAPYHFGCRTYHVPTILFGDMTRRQKSNLSKETREALQRGMPDADTSTKAFNRLSSSRQKAILGPTRYKLHKENKLSYPRDFVDQGDHRLWTLQEIAKREGIEIN